MSLDDFGDTPLSDTPTHSPEVVDFLDWLRDLASDSRTAYAADTLDGIAETVRKTNRISDGQRQAVENIVAGAQRGYETRERNRSSRRYEGWRR